MYVFDATATDPWADLSNPFGVKPLGEELLKIEEDFWTTPQLEYLALRAEQRGVGRWSLLGVIEANALSWFPHYVVLSNRLDETTSLKVAGSLNYYVHILGSTGKGKSSLLGTADEILPPNTAGFRMPGQDPSEPSLITSGTGEAMLKAIVTAKQESEGDKNWYFEQKTGVLVQRVDEFSTLVAEYLREGTKAPGVVNGLWSGSLVGNSVSDERATTKVLPHSVRVIATRLGQPNHAARMFTPDLIDDGTCGRPMWLQASEKWAKCPVEGTFGANPIHIPSGFYAMMGGAPHLGINMLPPERDFPNQAMLPEHLLWIRQGAQERKDIAALVAADDAAELPPDKELQLTEEERALRTGRAIMAHSVLIRRKTAVALAAIHGRLQPNDDDWWRAGVQVRVHMGNLAFLAVYQDQVANQEAAKKGTLKGRELRATQDFMEADEVRIAKEIVHDSFNTLLLNGPMRISALYKGSDRKKKMTSRALTAEVERPNGCVYYDDSTRLWYARVNGALITEPTKSKGTV